MTKGKHSGTSRHIGPLCLVGASTPTSTLVIGSQYIIDIHECEQAPIQAHQIIRKHGKAKGLGGRRLGTPGILT